MLLSTCVNTPFTTVCSITCMRVLQGASRPVWTGPLVFVPCWHACLLASSVKWKDFPWLCVLKDGHFLLCRSGCAAGTGPPRTSWPSWSSRGPRHQRITRTSWRWRGRTTGTSRKKWTDWTTRYVLFILWNSGLFCRGWLATWFDFNDLYRLSTDQNCLLFPGLIGPRGPPGPPGFGSKYFTKGKMTEFWWWSKSLFGPFAEE